MKQASALTFLLRTSTLITTLLFVSTTLQAKILVGSDGGSISVGNSGQAVWSMPVEVPSGINGVAPNLTVSVSSSGGNGSLGVGGGLSGLSSISRCGRTVHQDGYFQAPQYKITDAYCLDGARLVLESGSYGESGSVYRTEIESFQRVKAHGSVNGKGPAYFEVTNRNGATLIYGKNANTKEVDAHSGAAAVWKIDELKDSNSNTLHYHYADISGSGEFQFTGVTYGGNTAEGVSEHLAVVIVYEDRPDTSSVWSRGQRYSQTKRIAAIKTTVNDKVVKDYRFTYEQGEITDASRLSSVQLCAGDGDCYRPSKFEYVAETKNNWQYLVNLPIKLQSGDGKPYGMFVDINNDGKTEWVNAYKDAESKVNIRTVLSSNSGFSEITALKLPDVLFDYSQNNDGFAKGLLLDVNSDGWPDYVQAYKTSSGQVIQTWRNTGDGFVLDSSLKLPVALTSLQTDGKVRSLAEVTDLNADGLIDIVESVNINGTIVQKTWMHKVVDGAHSWQLSAAYKAPTIAIDYTQGTEGRVLSEMQDVNADGLVDWVQSYRVNNATVNNTWLNTGQGWIPSSQYKLPVALFNYDLSSKGIAEYIFTDLNGDGLPDLSKSINVNGSNQFDSWIHNGLQWNQDSSYNLPAASMLVNSNGNTATLGGLIDLNSDGQPDYVESYSDGNISSQKHWIFDKESKAWKSSTKYSFPFINNIVQADGTVLSTQEMVDLNHDGYPELINNATGDIYQIQGGGTDQYPGTLKKTINPMGAVTQLNYGISTDPELYVLAEQSPYPNIAYNAPVRLIKSVSASNGIGGFVTALHKYGKAKTNLEGQGGLGYQFHSLQDGNSGVTVATTFHQTYPYAGRVKASSKFIGETTLTLSNSEMQMVDITINNLTTQFPHPNSSVGRSFDANGNLLKITRSTSEIDNFGNATVSVSKVFDAQDNLVRTSTKTVTYKQPNLSTWLFGLPSSTKTELFDVAENKTYTNFATAEFYADGKPKSEVLEPNSDQWVKKEYTYDGFGNRTTSKVTAAGIVDANGALEPRISTTTFTADGRFPKQVKNALNHTISTVFNPLLGKPMKVVDANGITKEFLYDGFGTTIRESKTHQSNGATRGRQVVIPKWCDSTANAKCPTHAAYFIAAFDDEGEAPEIAYYDMNGKELRKQTYGFDGKIIVVDTQYDENSKVVRVSQPYFLGSGGPAWSSFEYDFLGRETKRIDAEGAAFLTAYNGLTLLKTNPGNKDTAAQTTKVTNNIFGQPIESVDADGNSTKYYYDGRGKLVKTVDSKGNVGTISYDEIFGRKIAMNDPDLGQWSYQYNSLGQLTSQTDANGQRTEMQYDILGRLVRRVDDANGDKQEVSTWEYSNVKSNDGDLIGALKKVNSPNFERTLKYDNFSRVVEVNSTVDGKAFQQRTGYHGTADKVDWVQYPSGLSVRNTYDDYGFPKTVEGISLDYSKYQEFQKASKELNDLQRQLENYKDAQLTDDQLLALEEHERQVRRLSKALSEFYDEFDANSDKKTYEKQAQRYSDILERVQQKLTQHSNWQNIYSKEIEKLQKKLEPDFEKIDELKGWIKYHQRKFNDAKALRDNYLAKENRYARLISEQYEIINPNVIKFRNNTIHINNLIKSLYIEREAQRYRIKESNGGFDLSGFEAMLNDLKCCEAHVINTFMKTQNLDLVKSHLDQINAYADKMYKAGDAIGAANKKIEDGNWVRWYEHWMPRRKGEEKKMVEASSRMSKYTSEINEIAIARVNPANDRIKNWLIPITKSHGNMLLSFNDRAGRYANEISKRTGSYVKRDDLKSEKFLKPFKNHFDYIDCLMRQSDKSTGQCYAENLVHILKEDGSVDATKQAEAREKVDDDTIVNIKDFWSTRRYFCSSYYGYSCPSKYQEQIKQLTKTMHIRQCGRMTAEQKKDSKVSCDHSTWQDDHVYLGTAVSDISFRMPSVYSVLVSNHQAEVERLVTIATKDTYNPERYYSNIIQLGGNLWQARKPEPVAKGKTDPREYVLLRRGHVQSLAQQKMSGDALLAVRTLKIHQKAVARIMDSGNTDKYNTLYTAVQAKAEQVQQLYKEIDQAYAQASNDDNFSDAEFNKSKKVYWQAQDINAKGQITQAKYGNNTTTMWTYDRFGRINGHVTKNAANQTLLNNSYQYDAIGNLTQRADLVEQVTEDFNYDILNRLVQSRLSGSGTQKVAQVNNDVVDYSYDELGNLIYKSDILGGDTNGRYTYGDGSSNAGPHAVTSITGIGNFTYDKNGNQLTGNGRTIVYSAFNKPTSILKGGQETRMWYGPERQLIKQQQPTPKGLETTVYISGGFEQITVKGNSVTNRHHIAVAGSAIAVVDTEADSLTVKKETYLHKNHQSSILAISDMNGAVVERRYYDAFGNIRNNVGVSTQSYTAWLGYDTPTSRGFTGHRTLIAAGVIHMGGRVYDALIGRFLSADPHIQSPLNSQSLNRYSYTVNNPLSFVDPSGYIFKKFFKALKKLFKKIREITKKVLSAIKKLAKMNFKLLKKIGQFVKKYARVIVAVVAAVVVSVATAGFAAAAAWAPLTTALVTGAAAGAVSGLIMTGSLKGMLKGAFIGMVTGGISYGLGGVSSDIASNFFKAGTNALNHATAAINASLTGGVSAKLQGFSFSKGFTGGFIGFVAFAAVASIDAVQNALVKVQRWGANLALKNIQATSHTVSSAQHDKEGDLRDGGLWDDHIHPNEDIDVKVDDGVFEAEITYDCHGNADNCNSILKEIKAINNHPDVDIKFTKVDSSSVIPDLTISSTDYYMEGGYGYLKTMKTGSKFLYVNQKYIHGTTPLHELGHFFGFHHSPVYGFGAGVFRNSLMTPGHYTGPVHNNFTNREIRMLIDYYGGI